MNIYVIMYLVKIFIKSVEIRTLIFVLEANKEEMNLTGKATQAE